MSNVKIITSLKKINYSKLKTKKLNSNNSNNSNSNNSNSNSNSNNSNSNFQISDITYNNLPLLIQTPNLYLPFGLVTSTFSTTTTKQSLSLGCLPQQNQIFQDQITELDDHLKTINSSSSSSNWTPSIIQPQDLFYPPVLKAKVHPQIPLQIYDIYHKIKPNTYLVPGSWAQAILCPKYLWSRPDNAGITWYVLQVKVKPPIPILDECLISDDNSEWQDQTLCAICYKKILKSKGYQFNPNTNTNTNTNNTNTDQYQNQKWPEEYQKYQKMLKLGIPILAVIQKCQMDGLDPEILQKRKPNIPTQAPPPPPLPRSRPRPHSHRSSSSSSSSSSSFLPQQPRIIFSATDLQAGRSILGTKKPKKTNKITLNLKKRDPRVPSLNMILERLQKLKPTTDNT